MFMVLVTRVVLMQIKFKTDWVYMLESIGFTLGFSSSDVSMAGGWFSLESDVQNNHCNLWISLYTYTAHLAKLLFFFSFPIHVHKCDSQAAWYKYFSGLEKGEKTIFYLLKEFWTCSDDLTFTLEFWSKKITYGDLISGVWGRSCFHESLPWIA